MSGHANYPVLTPHGAQTVDIDLTGGAPGEWVGYTEERLSEAQQAQVLYVARNEATNRHSIAVDATGGTFDLDIGAESLAAVDFDVTASALQTAVDGLTGVTAGDVVVTGGPGDDGGTTPYVLDWQPTGDLYGTATPAVATDPASLTGGAGTAVVTASHV